MWDMKTGVELHHLTPDVVLPHQSFPLITLTGFAVRPSAPHHSCLVRAFSHSHPLYIIKISSDKTLALTRC